MKIILNDIDNLVINSFLSDIYNIDSFNLDHETDFKYITDIAKFLNEGLILSTKAKEYDARNDYNEEDYESVFGDYNHSLYVKIMNNLNSGRTRQEIENKATIFKNRFNLKYGLCDNSNNSHKLNIFRMEIIATYTSILNIGNYRFYETKFNEPYSYGELLNAYEKGFGNYFNLNFHHLDNDFLIYFINRIISDVVVVLKNLDPDFERKRHILDCDEIKIAFLKEFYKVFLQPQI